MPVILDNLIKYYLRRGKAQSTINSTCTLTYFITMKTNLPHDVNPLPEIFVVETRHNRRW